MDLEKNQIDQLVDSFIKKILEIDKNCNSLDDKIKNIIIYLDNLIDFCIKKNIFYYIENKITYTNITKNFKKNLFIYLQNLIDVDNNIIDNYFKDINTNDFDNVSDINTIIFNKFKYTKNKVQFDDNNSLISMNDDFNQIKFNHSNDNINKNSFTSDDENKLAIYIKILINKQQFLIEFITKITNMCEIIYDPSKNYNPENPF